MEPVTKSRVEEHTDEWSTLPTASPPPTMLSSIPPLSSGSAALTSSTGFSNTTLLITVLAVVGFVGIVLVIVLLARCLWHKQRRSSGPYHLDPPNPRGDALDGRTTQYLTPLSEIKVITFGGKNDVRIMPLSVPYLPTSQSVLNTGFDSSSGFQLASQQPSPPPPCVCRPSLPTSQPALNSGVDSSSGFPATQRPSPPPVSVFSSGENSSSGFRRSQQPLPPPSPGIFSLGISKKFTYEELKAATDNFSRTNLLGEGGFAHVYKGTLLGHKHIAVKRFKVPGRDGESHFQAEVEIISSVRHRHLVSFLGYCIDQNQRLLVCEFVPNNTLKYHLHGKGQPTMEWPKRLNIAIGTAHGIDYLHEGCHPKIIHRDIKPSNILIDSNFEAKIADFGVASEGSRVNTMAKGTPGYLDPEFLSSGQLTDKSDVFSFGVVLIELITGRGPLDLTRTYPESTLACSARPLLARALEDGNLDTLVDARLQNNYNVGDMMRVVACAAACVQHSARSRPCMKRIVLVLEGAVSPEYLQESVPGRGQI